MPKHEPVVEETTLTEHRALAGAQGKKREFMTFGRKGRQLRRPTRIYRGMQGANLKA